MNNAMNTHLSTKLAAFLLALSINTVIMGGVAFMFSTSAHGVASLPVAAKTHQLDRAAA